MFCRCNLSVIWALKISSHTFMQFIFSAVDAVHV